MTEIAIHEGSSLAIEPQQTGFNDMQVSALAQIGVDKATPGDLAVFFHVCQRSGLDPFARQIYMIGRESSEKGADGQWRKVTKQTIQTGIDGFRLIGRRAADHGRHGVSVAAPEWAHEDGSWRPVWRSAWDFPVAARVTIHRNGEPFTAVALFDEYKQTKRDGTLTSMWAQRPAGQIAKCAEALAWRMAFPQDLSGIYTDDEMGQADRVEPTRHTVDQTAPAPDRMRAMLTATQETPGSPPPVEGDPEASGSTPTPSGADASGESPLLNTSGNLAKRMFATLGDLGITQKADRLTYVSDVLGRPIESSTEMTDDDAQAVINAATAELLATPGATADALPEGGA